MTSSYGIAFQILLHFAMLSLLAIGGGVISLSPDMMRFVSETHGWVSRAEFMESFTLAQIAPGPNFLFATLVGMRAAGFPGALAATIGLVVPPALLTILTLRYGGRHLDGPWGRRVRVAVQPLAIGMMAATAWALAEMTLLNVVQGAAFTVATAILLWTRLNPLWLIAVAGTLGAGGLL